MTNRDYLEVPLLGRSGHITLIATWRHDITSFVVKVCLDSIFNHNTKLWTKTESLHIGHTPNELPSVEILLDYLEGRGWIDIQFLREHAPYIEECLQSAMRVHHFS